MKLSKTLTQYIKQISYRVINNPFDKSLSQDETISTRDSCDIETSSTRTDFFDLELQNLHSKNSDNDFHDFYFC